MDHLSGPQRDANWSQRRVDRRTRSIDLVALLLLAALLIAGTWLLLGNSAAEVLAPPPMSAFGLLSLVAVLTLSFNGFASFARSRILWLKRAILLAIAAVLTLYVLQRIPLLGREGDYSGVFIAWVLASMLYAVTFAVTNRGSGWRLLPRWRLGLHATLVLIGITLVAALVRLWDLHGTPYIFTGDESGFSLRALASVTGQIRNPFGTDWLSQPTLGMFFEGLALRVGGATVEASRLPWALLGLITVPVSFCLASRIRGTAVGLVTAALVAVYHFHIHYSRMALNNIADPLFLALAILFLIIAIERKSPFAWMLVGASCGLALYFYQGARLTPLVLLAVAAYLFVRQGKSFRRRLLPGVAVAAGAFLVVAAPILQYALSFPDDFNARVNLISIFKPGWLDAEIARTGLTNYQILWEQLRRSALAFNVFPDTSPHYHLLTPLLDPFFGIFFLVGLAYGTIWAIAARSYWRVLPLVVWWWSGMFTGGALTLGPPASQRLITLAVPVCFFIALALELAFKSLRQLRFAIPLRPALALAVLLFAVISLKTYFVDYLPRNLQGGPPDPIAMALIPELRALSPQAHVYFAGSPVMYWGYASITYLAPGVQGSDLTEPLARPPAANLVAPGQEAIFVFLPHRNADLDYVRQTFQNGTTMSLVSPDGNKVLATIYKVVR